MNLAVYEWRKLFRLPALWTFLALCLAFNAPVSYTHLRVQPGLQLPELGPKALRLRLQALIFLLQLILALRRLLGSLLDIVDHVLLVKSAERNGFKGIIFHGPVLSFLLIGDDPTLTQKSSIDKGLKNKKKIRKKVLHFKSRRAIINKLSDRTCALSSAG